MNLDLITAAESLVTGALGGLGTVYGLSRWLGNLWLEKRKSEYSKEIESVKAEYSKELEDAKAQYSKELEGLKAHYSEDLEAFRNKVQQEQKRLQAEIDKSVFVTRAHFETEFAAMKELFSYLADVQLTMNALRPTIDIKPTKKDEKLAELRELYGKFSIAYNQLLKHTEALSPFYPPELYAAVDECLKAASAELMQVKLGGDSTFGQEWYQEGIKNRQEFGHGYEKVSSIIRERVAKLTVLPTT